MVHGIIFAILPLMYLIGSSPLTLSGRTKSLPTCTVMWSEGCSTITGAFGLVSSSASLESNYK